MLFLQNAAAKVQKKSELRMTNYDFFLIFAQNLTIL